MFLLLWHDQTMPPQSLKSSGQERAQFEPCGWVQSSIVHNMIPYLVDQINPYIIRASANPHKIIEGEERRGEEKAAVLAPTPVSLAMSLTSSFFLQVPSHLKPHHPSPLLHGRFPSLSSLPKFPPLSSRPPPPPPPSILTIRAAKVIKGRVVCATNDKTVSVEVTRLVPHPKYKRRIRIKKKFQAHDPDNQFKVGEYVELQKSRPISKTKHFIAVPYIDPHVRKAAELPDLPLQSQQPD